MNKRFQNTNWLVTNFSDTMLCANSDPNKQSNSCQGDSGGPLAKMVSMCSIFFENESEETISGFEKKRISLKSGAEN